MAERKVKAWITVNGVHVPIFEGESKEDAVKRSISKAKENAKANEDQKEKDIAKNKAIKDKMNKYVTDEVLKEGKNIDALMEKRGEIIDKYGVNSKEYEQFRADVDLGKSNYYLAKRDEVIEKYGFDSPQYKKLQEHIKDFISRSKNRNNKGSLSDASAGKASDEAREKKDVLIDDNGHGTTYKYKVVDKIEDGYEVWNIGKNFKHQKDNYVPLVKVNNYNVNTSNMRAIKMTSSEVSILEKGASRGFGSVKQIEKRLKTMKDPKKIALAKQCLQILKKYQ